MWNLINTFNTAEKIPKFRSSEAKCFTLGCVIIFAENSFRLQHNILILLQYQIEICLIVSKYCFTNMQLQITNVDVQEKCLIFCNFFSSHKNTKCNISKQFHMHRIIKVFDLFLHFVFILWHIYLLYCLTILLFII